MGTDKVEDHIKKLAHSGDPIIDMMRIINLSPLRGRNKKAWSSFLLDYPLPDKKKELIQKWFLIENRSTTKIHGKVIGLLGDHLIRISFNSGIQEVFIHPFQLARSRFKRYATKMRALGKPYQSLDNPFYSTVENEISKLMLAIAQLTKSSQK